MEAGIRIRESLSQKDVFSTFCAVRSALGWKCEERSRKGEEDKMTCKLCGHALSHLTAVLAQTEIGTQCPNCWTPLRTIYEGRDHSGKKSANVKSVAKRS